VHQGPFANFLLCLPKVRHIQQELCHWSHTLQLELGDVNFVKVIDPCNRVKDSELIFIHWAIIIQIIVGSILGKIAHDRTRSCQNSNLYIIYDIVPDIYIVVPILTSSFDIVLTKKRISTFFFDIDVKKRRYQV
jgi:hypothetical protein